MSICSCFVFRSNRFNRKKQSNVKILSLLELRTDRQRTLSAQVRFRAQQVEEDADLALQLQIQELTRLEASPRNYNQPVTRAPVPTALPGLTENQSRNTPIDRNRLQMNVVQILPPIQVQYITSLILKTTLAYWRCFDIRKCTWLSKDFFWCVLKGTHAPIVLLHNTVIILF